MERTAPEKRRRMLKTVFFAFLILLWLPPAALLIEVHARYQVRNAAAAAETWRQEIMQRTFEEEATFQEKIEKELKAQGLYEAARGYRPLTDFHALDEAGRRASARERNALVLLCDKTGVITWRFAPDDTGLPGALLKQARQDAQILDLFETETRPDAENAINSMVHENAGMQMRDYPFHFGEETPVIEFIFYPLWQDKPAENRLLIVVRPSIWAVLWERFAPDRYREIPVRFETNRLGWRDDEIVLPKPPGLFRIACVGGSTTAEGETNQLTWPAFLERMLGESFPANRIEVINCGIYAIGSDVERKNFPDYLALDPDLILHYNFVNDFTWKVEDWLQMPAFTQDPGGWIKAVLRHSTACQHWLSPALLPADRKLRRSLAQSTLRNLRAMADQARAAGVPMAFCSFAAPEAPGMATLEKAYFNRAIGQMHPGWNMTIAEYSHIVSIYNGLVKALCAESGAFYVPVAEDIHGGIDVFSDICHMHLPHIAAKARLIRDGLKPYLEKRLALSAAGQD
jgi:hypothetical protein